MFDLFDLFPDPIFVHQDGRCLYANAAAAELFGTSSAGAMVGREIAGMLANRQLATAESALPMPDGTQAVLLVVRRGTDEAELRRLASALIHDVNNALMAISPWAETLKRRYPNEEIIQKAAAAIAQAIQKGRAVTEQIREFTKRMDRSTER